MERKAINYDFLCVLYNICVCVCVFWSVPLPPNPCRPHSVINNNSSRLRSIRRYAYYNSKSYPPPCTHHFGSDVCRRPCLRSYYLSFSDPDEAFARARPSRPFNYTPFFRRWPPPPSLLPLPRPPDVLLLLLYLSRPDLSTVWFASGANTHVRPAHTMTNRITVVLVIMTTITYAMSMVTRRPRFQIIILIRNTFRKLGKMVSKRVARCKPIRSQKPWTITSVMSISYHITLFDSYQLI